jgi:hypothetical protein
LFSGALHLYLYCFDQFCTGRQPLTADVIRFLTPALQNLAKALQINVGKR